MARDGMTVALVTEVFHDDTDNQRLVGRLLEARAAGAGLAVLPELPLNPWSPAHKTARDEDAEAPEGPRHQRLASAAATAGIAVLGGAIVRCAEGHRHNTALLLDGTGRLVSRYRKLHLPEEEGYWETSHYVPGTDAPVAVTELAVPLGIQICSDANRPQGCHLLGAQGAEAILLPRATPRGTYARWRLVLRANAVTTCAYVVSVNRPGPEPGTEMGGASLAIAPDGEVLVETEAPLALVEIERAAVREARGEYPGYLPVRSDLYQRAWAAIAEGDSAAGR